MTVMKKVDLFDIEDYDIEKINSAIDALIKSGKVTNNLSIGFKNSLKSVGISQAGLCIIPNNFSSFKDRKEIIQLCEEMDVPVLTFEGGKKKLGEMLGLHKVKKSGEVGKVKRCSCLVIKKEHTDDENVKYLSQFCF